MGWFSSIMGTAGVVDGIKDGIDKSILTDEERLDYHKEMLKAYEPFKLIQRGLAFFTAILFGFIVVVEVCLVIGSIWFPELKETIKYLNSLEHISYVGAGFLTIMSLYFSGGVINSIRGKK